MRGRIPSSKRVIGPIAASAGIGLRAPHYRALLATRPAVGFLEVHSENYFGGGAPAHFLQQAREHYPLSLHGIGLSLGSTDPLSLEHLRQLKTLIARYEPWLVSEHLCWASVGGCYFNDLLPLPCTHEVVAHLAARIAQTQDYLGRQILVENLSSYLVFADGALAEWEMLVEVARRSGCGLLLDVNNVYVAACNHGFDPHRYLDAIPTGLVQEIHLAGHSERALPGSRILIDTHNAPVCDAVWSLYRRAVQRFGPLQTLIEWDQDFPPLAELVGEAHKARAILEERHAIAA
jgi:uncharacterized protein